MSTYRPTESLKIEIFPILNFSPGKFLDGIRPMTCVTQSTPKQHQQQHQYEGRQQNNVNVDHQPSPVLAKKEGEHIGADSSNFNDILAYLR